MQHNINVRCRSSPYNRAIINNLRGGSAGVSHISARRNGPQDAHKKSVLLLAITSLLSSHIVKSFNLNVVCIFAANSFNDSRHRIEPSRAHNLANAFSIQQSHFEAYLKYDYWLQITLFFSAQSFCLLYKHITIINYTQ